MSKQSKSIQIPDDIAEALEAFAKASGKTQGEMIVGILRDVLGNRLFKPYINNGEFDQKRFHADMHRTRQQLNQWHREHPAEVANLRRASAAVRKRVRHA